MRDLSQAIGIIVGVINRRLAKDGHADSSIGGIIITDGALRRRFRGQAVMVVVGARNRAAGQLAICVTLFAVSYVKVVVDRVRIGRQSSPVSRVVPVRNRLAVSIRKLSEPASHYGAISANQPAVIKRIGLFERF